MYSPRSAGVDRLHQRLVLTRKQRHLVTQIRTGSYELFRGAHSSAGWDVAELELDEELQRSVLSAVTLSDNQH